MPKLSIQELDKELRFKKLRPAYLIYGAENYLIHTAIKRIRDHLSVQAETFSAKSTSLSEILMSAKTVSMWSPKRLLIVSDSEKIAEAEQLSSYLKKPLEDVTLIFTAEKMDGRTKFAQIFNEHGAVIECKPLYDNQLPDWVRMEAQTKGKAISLEAARMLPELVGKNLGELSQAIEKLILYVGAKPSIDLNDVEIVLTETGERTVFEFGNAVGSRDISKALHILQRMNESGENEVMILTMLARHWRLLLKAKEAGNNEYDLARTLGVNPFFAKDYARQCSSFKLEELKRGFKQLYFTDKLLKSSKMPKWMILEKCVRKIILHN